MQVRIIVSGCDDSTIVRMEVTEAQFDFLVELRKLINSAVTNGCMPTMSVEPIPGGKECETGSL